MLCTYFEKYASDGNFSGRHLWCSPSTTQNNFYFFEIHIFEYYMLKQIPKFLKINSF